MNSIVEEMIPEEVIEEMMEKDTHPCSICGEPKSIYEEGYECGRCKNNYCPYHGHRFMTLDGHCLKCEDIENE